MTRRWRDRPAVGGLWVALATLPVLASVLSFLLPASPVLTFPGKKALMAEFAPDGHAMQISASDADTVEWWDLDHLRLERTSDADGTFLLMAPRGVRPPTTTSKPGDDAFKLGEQGFLPPSVFPGDKLESASEPMIEPMTPMTVTLNASNGVTAVIPEVVSFRYGTPGFALGYRVAGFRKEDVVWELCDLQIG